MSIGRAPSKDDIEIIVAQHDAQIKGLASQVGSVIDKLDEQSSELHKLNSSLALLAGKSPAMDAKSFMSTVLQAGAIVGAMVTGILYITQSSFAPKLAALDANDISLSERIQSQQMRVARLESILLYKGAGLPQPTP